MPFSRSALILFIALATVLFSLSFILNAVPAEEEESRVGDALGTYSPAATGYKGLYEFLRRTEHAVMRGTDSIPELAGIYGTVIVTEPYYYNDTDYMTLPRVLIVLPKWNTVYYGKYRHWASEITLLDEADVINAVKLYVSDIDFELVRVDWRGWDTNAMSYAPTGDGYVQLLHSDIVKPLVANGDGILLGELETKNQRIWILSDPDVLNNYGLFKGDNALFMLEVMDELHMWANSDPSTPIVFDEAIHGYQMPSKSPLDLLFQFPYSVVALLVLATALLMLVSGAGRFGPPAYKDELINFGKERLIVNGARLLNYSGHQRPIMQRYINMTVAAVAHALHAPKLNNREQMAWLDRVGTARGVKISCGQVKDAAGRISGDDKESLRRLFEYVQQIYKWKGEILK